MRKVIYILVIATILFSSCQTNKDKKEAAKEYMKKQTIYYNEPKNNEQTSIEEEFGLVVNLTDKSFDNGISSGVVLVDFWAEWCRPCRIQGPIVDEIAHELEGKLKVAKVDVDNNRLVSQRFNIESIPTLILYKDGQVIEKLVGLQDKATLMAYISKHVTL